MVIQVAVAVVAVVVVAEVVTMISVLTCCGIYRIGSYSSSSSS